LIAVSYNSAGEENRKRTRGCGEMREPMALPKKSSDATFSWLFISPVDDCHNVDCYLSSRITKMQIAIFDSSSPVG
jgi:hypothetical protein